jgi:hypothetical protein
MTLTYSHRTCVRLRFGYLATSLILEPDLAEDVRVPPCFQRMLHILTLVRLPAHSLL